MQYLLWDDDTPSVVKLEGFFDVHEGSKVFPSLDPIHPSKPFQYHLYPFVARKDPETSRPVDEEKKDEAENAAGIFGLWSGDVHGEVLFC